MNRYVYKTCGTCSRSITLLIEGSLIAGVEFAGGCNGNLQGLSRMVKGMRITDVIEKLRGINCNGKGTSCPDQLARALTAYCAGCENESEGMNYNFDRIYDRRNTGSLKWDCTEKIFNSSDILPMWIADMDFPVPPAVTDAIRKRNEHGIFGYMESIPQSYGDAIIDWVRKRHQWTVDSRWLSYTPGVVPALSTAILAFTEPGDRVAVQSPVYPPFFRVIRDHGRQLVNNPLKLQNGRYEMDFDDLEGKMKTGIKAIILCSPHNPVGRVWSREELSQLGELCLRYNILVISDEIHSDIVFTGHRHVSLASLSERLAYSSVTCVAASKTFGIAGLAASTVIIPDAELRAGFLNKIQSLGIESGNIFGITASEAAYRYGGAWLEQLLFYLEGNLRLLEEYFARNIPGIKVIKPEGTYLVWMDCRGLGLNPEALPGFMAQEAKIGLNDGRTFGAGGEGFLRMNIACPRATLEEGLRRMERAVRNICSLSQAPRKLVTR